MRDALRPIEQRIAALEARPAAVAFDEGPCFVDEAIDPANPRLIHTTFYADDGTPVPRYTWRLDGLPLYQGIWSPTVLYAKGDCVTSNGNVWIAIARNGGVRRDTAGEDKEHWCLMVRRGGDGRDAREYDRKQKQQPVCSVWPPPPDDSHDLGQQRIRALS